MFASAYMLKTPPLCYLSWQSSEVGMRSSDKGDNKAAGTIEEFRYCLFFSLGALIPCGAPRNTLQVWPNEWYSTPEYKASKQNQRSHIIPIFV